MENSNSGTVGTQERIIITENEAGMRADVALAQLLEITRSNMQKFHVQPAAVPVLT